MRPFVLLTASLALLAASAAPARADLPPGSNSIIPAFIRLVSADPYGHPDPAGVFQVVVRDLANNPVVGSQIIVDFTATTDVALCDVQAPGVTRVATGAMGVTGADGSVTMTLLGHAIPGAAPSPPRAVKIYADGVLLGSVPCCAFDLDGAGGVGGADLSRWLADFITGSFMARGDYDGSGALGATDVSVWLSVFVRGTSAQSCPAVVTAPN
jgi:hypothetical protein